MESALREVERLAENGHRAHERGALEEAAAYLQASLELAERTTQRPAPKLRTDLAVILIDLRRPQQARAVLAPIVDGPSQDLDDNLANDILLTYGNVLYHLGENEHAREVYERSLTSLAGVLPATNDRLVNLTINVALCHSRAGRRRQSLRMLENLLASALTPALDRRVRYFIAVCLDELGLQEASQAVLEQVLETAPGAERADLYSSLAIVNDKQGRSGVALDLYGRALEAAESLGDARRQFGHIIVSYASYAAGLGDEPLVASLRERIRGWMGADASAYDEIVLLEMDVNIAMAKQDFDEAQVSLGRIETLRAGICGRGSVEVYHARSRMADVVRQRGEKETDTETKRRCLDAAEVIVASASADFDGPPWSIDRVPSSILQAELLRATGRAAQVVASGPELLSGACDLGIADTLYQALRLVALAHAEAGDLILGVALHKIATERMRQSQLLMSACHRETPYNEDAAGTMWRELVALLAGAQRLPEAEMLQNCYKRDRLLDAARRDEDSSAPSLAVPMTRQEDACSAAFEHIVGARRRALTEVVDLSDEAASRRWDMLVGEMRAWLQRVAVASRQPDRPITTIRPPVTSGQILIRYMVFPEKTVASVRSSTGDCAFDIGVPAAMLGRLCFDFRSAIVEGDVNSAESGHALFELLLEPAWHLISSATHLCIDADGALHHLPFCALMKDAAFLVEHVAISFNTGSLAIGRRPTDRASWRWLGAGIASLAEVKGELEALPGGVRKTVLLADGFTPDALSTALNGGIEIVHVASHFHLNPVNAGRSSLEMGDGSRLSLDMLRQTDRFDFTKVELLYLSACSTGSAAHGADALESLAGIFQSRGVRNVMGTLWPVLDSDARKMAEAFYAAVESVPALDWSQALRQAQIDMINTPPDVSAHDDPPRRGMGLAEPTLPGHPVSWAAHVLFGG